MAGSTGKIKGKQTELYFSDLIDVPSSYSGNGGDFLSVNSNEDGIEFTTITTPKNQYDIIVDRSDYASDSLAGTALKSTLESSSYKTVFITNGIYDIGTNNITLDSNIVYVEGESHNNVIIKTNNGITSFKNFSIGHESTIKNITIESYSSAKGETFFDLDGTKKIILINCYADASNKTNYKDISIGFHGTSQNILIKCYNCSGDSLNRYFYNVGLVKDTIIDKPIGQNPFQYIEFVENIVFSTFANSVNNKITTNNVEVFENVNFGNNILINCESNVSIEDSILYFQNCNNFTNIKIDSSSYKITIGNYSASPFFLNCNNFTNIDINIDELDFTGSGSFSSGSFISNCEKFSNLNIIISTLSYTPTGYLSDRYLRFFYNCDFFNNFYLEITKQITPYICNECNYFENGYIELTDPDFNGLNSFIIYFCKKFVNVQIYIPSNSYSKNNYCFFSSYQLLNCVAKGNSTTSLLKYGFYSCRSVIGCHSHDTNSSSYHYFNCNGYSNSYSGIGSGVSGGTPYSSIAISESDLT